MAGQGSERASSCAVCGETVALIASRRATVRHRTPSGAVCPGSGRAPADPRAAVGSGVVVQQRMRDEEGNLVVAPDEGSPSAGAAGGLMAREADGRVGSAPAGQLPPRSNPSDGVQLGKARKAAPSPAQAPRADDQLERARRRASTPPPQSGFGRWEAAADAAARQPSPGRRRPKVRPEPRRETEVPHPERPKSGYGKWYAETEKLDIKPSPPPRQPRRGASSAPASSQPSGKSGKGAIYEVLILLPLLFAGLLFYSSHRNAQEAEQARVDAGAVWVCAAIGRNLALEADRPVPQTPPREVTGGRVVPAADLAQAVQERCGAQRDELARRIAQ